MGQTLRRVFGFVVTGVTTYVCLTGSREAEAASWIRHSANYCAPFIEGGDFPGNDWADNNLSFSGGKVTVGTNGLGWLACPLTDNSSQQHQNMTDLLAYVKDNSTTGSVDVSTCAVFWNATGASCSASASTSVAGTGWSWVRPSRTALTSYPNEFAQLQIIASGTGSMVSGYVSYYQ